MDTVYKNQSILYKLLLYSCAVGFIVFVFPKGGKFKYEFKKGKPWQFENLYAPFDFSIHKTAQELNQEKQEILTRRTQYLRYNQTIVKEVYEAVDGKLTNAFGAKDYTALEKEALRTAIGNIIADIYKNGILEVSETALQSSALFLLVNNEARTIAKTDFFRVGNLESLIAAELANKGLTAYENDIRNLLFDVVKPNVTVDKELTKKTLEDALSKLSYTRGSVDEGKLIIAKGEVVAEENYKMLVSLKSEYESELWTDTNTYFILVGYTVLVALVLGMLLLFLKKYRNEVFENNKQVTFIFFNILLLVFFTTLVVNYNEAFVFIVPLCILPLILKTFFDARLGLFVHVLTVLILGFVVPNSFEYIFLQISAGIVTILTVSEFYKRANLFISVGQITLIYIVAYLAFHTIHEGNLTNIQWLTLGLFLGNGMVTLFVQPLIYIYEKTFGLVSEVSLLELSDTNSTVLKALSDKAPGTFNHSLQVANLAEAAANGIGANAMLVRVGALYHDIGKMDNPTYFTENQITNVNPHDEISPKESARIILDHVIKGIELARKNKIPDRVIDFIRSHHGTTVVHYFYRQQLELEPEASDMDFKYAGPLPFSKETAILMMADAVEAASKSLKNPNYTSIDNFVEKIIGSQMKSNQFINADITFKEIQTIKKIFKLKLTNIYHLRVEYPE